MKKYVRLKGVRFNLQGWQCRRRDKANRFYSCWKEHYIVYTGDYLRRNEYADVSKIYMTKNGYTALKYLEELTPKMAKGIRKLTIIKDTPAHW